MTKHDKEIQRKKMMWFTLFSMVFIMVLIIGLSYFGKSVEGLGSLTGLFFTSLAGINGASFFTTPSDGEDR